MPTSSALRKVFRVQNEHRFRGIRLENFSRGPASDVQRFWNLVALAISGLDFTADTPGQKKSQPVEGFVLSHCANPQCLRPFLRLRQGKLFLVETECAAQAGELSPPSSPCMRRQPRRVERYWLCDQCAEVWTLVHEPNHGIMLLPLRRAVAGAGLAMGAVSRSA
jgi:hypothetical protein